MALKNLLVAYNGTESSEAALDFALFMRDKYDAHLTGILAYSRPPTNQAASNWIPQDIRDTIEEAQVRSANDIEAKFKLKVASNSAVDKIHWISKRGDNDATIARYARFYDLTIIGRYDAVHDDQPELHPDMVAMMSGRPVMLIPRDFDMPTFDEHAVLAWDGKRASARALADAMQILNASSKVTIITIDDGDSNVALPEIDVETTLQRHGMKAEQVHLKRKSKSISHRLLKFLDETQPTLLVMGAYEHSKFRQSIFGGVTRRVLKETRIPIFISH